MTMPELAMQLVGHLDFDLMLVGDGSGNFTHTPCGWFVTVYEKSTGKTWECYGAANGGTNNYAELEPFNYALWSYRHVLWKYHAEKKEVKPPRVLIVSDSEITVRCGNRLYQRMANAPLWASIEWLENKGYTFEWVHVRRNSNVFNERADKWAGLARKAIAGLMETK